MIAVTSIQCIFNLFLGMEAAAAPLLISGYTPARYCCGTSSKTGISIVTREA